MKLPKIAVIIVNYNNAKDTAETIESVQKNTTKNHMVHVFLVNNGCTDGESALLHEEYPGITVINSPENLGFGKGNNLGVKQAIKDGYDYVLLLNNDATITSPDFFDYMLKSPYDISAPILQYDQDGKEILDYGGKIDHIFGRNTHLTSPGEADYFSGACLFMKTRVFQKLNGFDKDYFLYYEDTDLCLRAKELGFTLGLVPEVKVFHHLSASTNKMGSKKIKVLAFSHIKFCKRHLSKFASPFYITFNLYLNSKRVLPYIQWKIESFWSDIYPLRNKMYCLLNNVPVVHMIGDSHVWPYLEKHPFEVHHLGGITAYNLDNPKSTSSSLGHLKSVLSRIDKTNNLLVFVAGEIDCRLHIYYQYKKLLGKRSIDSLIKSTVLKYTSFLKKLQDDGWNITVLSPTPTGTEKNIYKMKYFTDFNLRSKITKSFNVYLQKTCKEKNLAYLDLYPKISTSEGGIQEKYRLDAVHLNIKVVPILRSLLAKSHYNKTK